MHVNNKVCHLKALHSQNWSTYELAAFIATIPIRVHHRTIGKYTYMTVSANRSQPEVVRSDDETVLCSSVYLFRNPHRVAIIRLDYSTRSVAQNNTMVIESFQYSHLLSFGTEWHIYVFVSRCVQFDEVIGRPIHKRVARWVRNFVEHGVENRTPVARRIESR